ncbi:talin-1-like [Elysia marginata]|uniref:Talin-1-like n=1 Tax=Elysia marginata TaxID=1093978 RepID=A0AAV4FGI4_9GAST|nr:talin-1-like [Elysia marginata]
MANQLTRDYTALATAATPAATASNQVEIGNRIRSTVQDLGTCCVDLVQDAGQLQASPTDEITRKELQDHAKVVNEKVSYVLAALQAGARGTQACINAASTVSGIIGDLDTTIMFASAGTLNDEGSESFADQSAQEATGYAAVEKQDAVSLIMVYTADTAVCLSRAVWVLRCSMCN